MRGVPVDESPSEEGADYAPSQNSIGHKYIKSLFRGYTGSNFTTLTVQPDWLGFQGEGYFCFTLEGRAEEAQYTDVVVF